MSGEGKRPHYGLLDTVRGVCILSMVAYHGMYDLVDIFGLPSAWYTGLPGYIWQQSICWTFILLSGMCWQLSRRHVKRGLLLVGCGAAITLITWLVMPSQRILYGVLNLLGLSALPTDSPQYVGMLGMHGNYGPNIKNRDCDLLLAVGMRFDDRVTVSYTHLTLPTNSRV